MPASPSDTMYPILSFLDYRLCLGYTPLEFILVFLLPCPRTPDQFAALLLCFVYPGIATNLQMPSLYFFFCNVYLF